MLQQLERNSKATAQIYSTIHLPILNNPIILNSI